MDIATVNYQRIANNFFFVKFHKSKFKASGQTGLRKNKSKFAYRISGFKRKKLHQITHKTYNMFKLTCVVSYSL